MQRSFVSRVTSAVLCASVVAASAAVAEDRITCMSDGGRYNYCSIRTDNYVRLERQISRTRCAQFSNWGYDRNGVWVDRGCSAEFSVGRYGDHGHGDHNKDAAVAVGAVGAVALIAALASKHHENDSAEVASWAVGTFRGYDDREQVDVEITILPGGSVSGFADGSSFSGSLRGSKLETGRQRFTIERSGTGFIAVDERDSRHRVSYRRTGGGY